MRVWLFVLVAGCGRIAFDPLSDGGGGSSMGSDASGVCPEVPGCPDRSVPVAIGMSSVSAPVLTNHGLSTSVCGSGNGNPELAVLLRPFDDAAYTINVTPASSAVYVQDGCCGGTELVCGQNPVTLQRKAGQNFVVVVEAFPSTQITVQVMGN